MTQFLRRALSALDAIYAFRGGQNTLDQFDLAGAVQPVHDVSREAELLAGYGNPVAPGWWWIGQANTHVGSDEQQNALNPRTVIEAANSLVLTQKPIEYDVWWYDCYCWSLVENIISLANVVAVYPAGLPGQTLAHNQLLAHFNGRVATSQQSGSAGGFDDAGTSTFPTRIVSPLILPSGTTLNTRTVAAAFAGDIAVINRIWVGPRGVRPPLAA